MMAFLIYLVIAVIVFSFAYWVIQSFVPEPFRKFGILIMALVAVIYIVWMLLGLTNGAMTLPHLAR